MEQYCQICLIYDIQMKFCDVEKMIFITNIFKQYGYNNVLQSNYVCYICDALLTKSYNFVKRALRAQQLLHEFIENNDLATVNVMLQDIDRFKLKLNYTNLSIQQTDTGSINDYEAVAPIKQENSTAEQNNIFCLNNRMTFENVTQDNRDIWFDSDNNTTHTIGHNESVNDLNENVPEEAVKNEMILKLEPYTVDIEPLQTYDPLDSIANDNNFTKNHPQYNATVSQTGDCNAAKSDSILKIHTLKAKNTLRCSRIKKKATIEDAESKVKLEFDDYIEVPKKTLRTNRRKKEAAIKDEPDKILLEIDGIEVPDMATLEPKKFTKQKYKRVSKPKIAIKGEYDTAMLGASSSQSNPRNTKKKYNKRRKTKKRKTRKQSAADRCTDSDDSECERQYPATCDDCDSIISTKREHVYHYLSEHKDIKYPYSTTNPPYVCEICGNKIIGRSYFKSHLLTHGEKNIHCEQCPKVFHTRVRMLVHVRRVHALRRYVCDYCEKKFPDKDSVRLHIRTHTGERPFKCHICGAGFAHKGNRLLHLRQHESRPYTMQDNEENVTETFEQKREKSSGRKQTIKKRKLDYSISDVI